MHFSLRFFKLGFSSGALLRCALLLGFTFPTAAWGQLTFAAFNGQEGDIHLFYTLDDRIQPTTLPAPVGHSGGINQLSLSEVDDNPALFELGLAFDQNPGSRVLSGRPTLAGSGQTTGAKGPGFAFEYQVIDGDFNRATLKVFIVVGDVGVRPCTLAASPSFTPIEIPDLPEPVFTLNKPVNLTLPAATSGGTGSRPRLSYSLNRQQTL